RAGRLPGRALSHGPAVVGHPRARQARHPQPERAHRAGTRRAARLGPDLPAAVRGRKAGRTVTASDTRPSSAAANPAEAQARYRPLILDENVPDDLAVLARLRATPTVAIRDLRDAIRAALAKLCEPPIDPGDLADERWVYYPWRRTLLGLPGARRRRRGLGRPRPRRRLTGAAALRPARRRVRRARPRPRAPAAPAHGHHRSRPVRPRALRPRAGRPALPRPARRARPGGPARA